MRFCRQIPRGGSLLDQADADQRSIEAAMEPCRLPGGSTVRVLDTGAGEAVIFVPMVAELGFVYAPQMEELGRDHRLLLHEPRLSRSTRVGIGDRAREIAEVLDARGIDRAHVVAWSDTGGAAYLFARDWPARCRSVTFLGLADRYRFPGPLQLGVRLLARLPVEGLLPGRALGHVLSRYLGGDRVPPSWIARRAGAIPELTRLFKHSVLPNLLEHAPRAGEVTRPALVICGDRDALVTVEQARRMAALLPGAGDAVILPGGEHFLGYVDPAGVNAAIRRFYRDLAAGRPG